MKYYMGFNGVGHGHGARCRAIAQELEQRCHQVVFTTYNAVYTLEEQKESSFSAMLKKDGYTIHDGIPEMHGISKNNMLDTYSTFIDARKKFLKVLAKGTKEQISIIKKENPDIIVSDGHISSVAAAKLLKIPHFIILNQNSINGLVPPQLKPLAKTILWYLQEGSQKIIIPDFEPPDTICAKNIENYGKRLDSKIVYTGPILRKEVFEHQAHPYESRTVYVCMGGQNKVSLERHLDRASRKLGLDFLVVNSYPRALENGIKHIAYQQNPIPYMKSALAIITHGGHSTLMEAIACGVPVIGITQETQERYHNIMGIQKRGLGRLVMLNDLEEELLDAIVNVTTDGFSQRAQYFAKKAKECQGTKRAADILTSI